MAGYFGAPDSQVPQYQQPADDEQTIALKEQAKRDQAAAGMERAQIDTASLLARYGNRLTLAASNGAGPAAPVTPPGISSDLNTILQRTG